MFQCKWSISLLLSHIILFVDGASKTIEVSEAPYHAVIIDHHFGGNMNQGAILSKKYVITCGTDFKESAKYSGRPTTDFSVVTNTDKLHVYNPYTYEVEKFFGPPTYKDGYLSYDLVLVKVKGEMVGMPIAVGSVVPKPEEKAVHTGFGIAGAERLSISMALIQDKGLELKSTEIKIASPYGRATKSIFGDTDTFTKDFLFPAVGDYGAPLVWKGTLVGLALSRIGNYNDEKVYNSYVAVGYWSNWIDGFITPARKKPSFLRKKTAEAKKEEDTELTTTSTEMNASTSFTTALPCFFVVFCLLISANPYFNIVYLNTLLQ